MFKSGILKLIHDLYYSFTNIKGKGFSARKLSAFAGLSVALYETAKIESDVYRLYAIGLLLLFVLLCLTVITGEQLIRLKSEKYEKFENNNNTFGATPTE
jgi:hypothetical protein